MTDETKHFHYKVGWKVKGSSPQVADYVAGSLKELLSVLKTSEGATPASTEYMVVHQINGDGTINEVFDHDEKTGLCTLDFRSPSAPPPRRPSQPVRRRSQWLPPTENEVLKELEFVLNKARGEAAVADIVKSPKPRIRLKNTTAVPKAPVEYGGYLYKAEQAVGMKRLPSKTESKKFGVEPNA